MKSFTTRFACIISLILVSQLGFADQYGAAISEGTPISLASAIEKLESQSSAIVLVSAKVGSVCEKKGCWMALTTADNEMRVTFKDYGFFVPFNIVGKTVTVEGKLEKIQMSLEESKHMVKDGGGNPDDVSEAISEYRMVASGVQVNE